MTPADLPSSYSRSASSTEAPPPTRSRARVVSLWVVAVLVALRVALPFGVEWWIPRLAAQQGLQAQIGNVDLGLIVGEISLEDLVVEFPPESAPQSPLAQPPEAEGPAPLVALQRLYVAFEWTDLLWGRFHITDLQLDRPVIGLTQLVDGSFKWPTQATEEAADAASQMQSPAVAAGGGADPSPESDDPQSAETGWAFMLDRFVLNELVFSLHSETTHTEVVHLSADRLGLDALSVGPNAIRLSGMDLEHPELFVQREWLLGLGASPSEPDDGPAEMPSVQMEYLNVQRAALTVQTRRGPVKVALRLKLTDAGTALGDRFPIEAALQMVDANIAIDGQLGLNPVSFQGRLSWQNLGVPPLLLLSRPELVAWLASCEAHGDLEITFHSAPHSGPAGLTARGNTSVTQLRFEHPETGELALGWESLEVEIREAFVPLEATPELRSRFELSRFELTSPRIVYTNPPDALDELLAALEGESTAAREPASDDEVASAVAISIAALVLKDGTLRYVDRSVTPTHETEIHALRARVDDFSTNPLAAEQVSVDGLIQSTGSFKLRGGLPRGLGKLEFALRRLDLVSYDSLASGVGWHIEHGSSSLDSVIEAHGDGYETQNELVFHDLDVTPESGAGFSSRFGVSVDLALALLRDPSGDIALSMPIAFSADGTGVSLGPLLLSALRNALKGALASPIKMVGMWVPASGGAASFGILPFAPGEREPGPDAGDRLKPLAKLLANRPMLSLALRGHWSPEDRPSLAMSILSELALSGGAFPDIENASSSARRRVVRALRARGAEGEGALDVEDAALLERYVKAQEVPIERYRAFAKARAENVRTALIDLGAPREALQLRPAEAADQSGVGTDLQPRAAQDG